MAFRDYAAEIRSGTAALSTIENKELRAFRQGMVLRDILSGAKSDLEFELRRVEDLHRQVMYKIDQVRSRSEAAKERFGLFSEKVETLQGHKENVYIELRNIKSQEHYLAGTRTGDTGLEKKGTASDRGRGNT